MTNDEIDLDLDVRQLPPEQRKIWLEWLAEEEELHQQFHLERLAEERDEREARDAQRDRDFADAVDKVSRSGYVGKHGTFVVPADRRRQMDAWQRQAQHGDYDPTADYGPLDAKLAAAWSKLAGIDHRAAKREYIRLANELITEYGWNPPSGWR